jgi:hypothetical protein
MLKKIIHITVVFNYDELATTLSPYPREVTAVGGLTVLAVSIRVLRSMHDLESICLYNEQNIIIIIIIMLWHIDSC